tara:strand:- start:2384 stop:2560 length:177 start_codon:yes stop_codon:yes gene_type:complete
MEKDFVEQFFLANAVSVKNKRKIIKIECIMNELDFNNLDNIFLNWSLMAKTLLLLIKI